MLVTPTLYAPPGGTARAYIGETVVATTSYGLVDFQYTHSFDDGTTDDLYAWFATTMDSIDTSATVALKIMARTDVAPAGSDAVLEVYTNIVRAGTVISATNDLTSQAVTLTGISATAWSVHTIHTYSAGKFADGDRVAIRFRRAGADGSDSLTAKLYIPPNCIYLEYTTTSPRFD